MPRTTIDYSKTIIYKIVCNDLNITDVYVGHTTNMVKRRWGHKTSCNNEKDKHYNLKIYQTIRANGGWDNWNVIQICEFPCSNLEQARAEERRHYELLNASLNMVKPIRYESEKNVYQKIWNNDNKDKIREQTKQWRIDNIDWVKEHSKQYYLENRDKFIEYQEVNKDKIAEQRRVKYEANKDKIAEQKKAYREANKDRIKQMRKLNYEANKDKIKEYQRLKYHTKKTE